MPTASCTQCGTALAPDRAEPLCSACVLATQPTQPASGAPAGSPPPRTFADYEILDEIARGGMGVVYRAREKNPSRVVALKMILAGENASPEEIQRFRVEAAAAAELAHPNIVPVYDVGEEDGRHYYSMKLVEGESLEDQLERGPLRPAEAARLIVTVARAVHFGHQRGILHRDLKPPNVLIEKGGQIYVTDFGLAKRTDPAARSLTETGVTMGTPSYMAPEQVEGHKQLSVAVDVWGLGAVLFEALTGRPPFVAETSLTIIRKVLDEEPPHPRTLNAAIDRDLETIVLKCLEKDPQRRYASADALADDLERWLARRPISARPVGPIERTLKWARRRPAAAGLVAVSLATVLIVVLGGAWFTVRTERARRTAVAARQELRLSLTRQMAERLDSDLRQLAAIPQVMAAALARRSDWTERQLADWMLETLNQDARVYGLCVAFEPHAFDPSQEHFALYVCRKTDPPSVMQLRPPGYRLYREWDWYRRAKEKRGGWGEPFVDVGGGDIPMVTYSAPVVRDGAFVGVATVDLSLEYFRVLRSWLAELRLGEESYAFVASAGGAVLGHPVRSMLDRAPEFERLRPGTLVVDGAAYCVARVPASDWIVVTVDRREP